VADQLGQGAYRQFAVGVQGQQQPQAVLVPQHVEQVGGVLDRHRRAALRRPRPSRPANRRRGGHVRYLAAPPAVPPLGILASGEPLMSPDVPQLEKWCNRRAALHPRGDLRAALIVVKDREGRRRVFFDGRTRSLSWSESKR
jgi:hypothetical protein